MFFVFQRSYYVFDHFLLAGAHGPAHRSYRSFQQVKGLLLLIHEG